METPAGELSRSPFDNVLNFVPQGHEKALKQAFYNTAAIIFVIFACGAGIAVYFVLEVFLKPLLWAVLCGTFLHPFKNSLTRLVRNWLRGLGTSYSPLAVGVITLPIKVADSASEALGNFILNYIKLILAVGIGLPLSYVLYHFGPIYKIFCIIETCCVYIYEILGYFSTLWVWSLVAAYLLVVIFYWTEHSNAVLRILSIPVWITLLFHLATIAGSFRIPIVITMITMMIVGFLAEINDTRAKRRMMGEAEDMSPTAVMTASAWAVFTSRNQSRSPSTSPQVSATGLEQDKSKEQDKCKEESATDMQVPKPPPSPRSSRNQQSSSSQTTVTGAPPPKRKSRPNKEHKVSDSYLMGLVWMCVLVRLWMHVWVLQLLPIPLGYLLIKRLGSHFGVWKFLQDKLSCAWEKVHQFVSKRQDALAPAFIRGLGKLMIRGDRKIISFLEQSLDKVTSILIILLVLIAAVVGTLVAALQVHQESMYLVSATSKLVNETVELNQWLPHRDSMKKAMDSMIGNAYLYGREWIGNKVKHALDGEDLVTSALLEKQVVEIWDKLYAAWKTSNISAPSQSVYKGGVFANWQSVVDTLSKSSGGLKPNDIISFVKENIDTFTSVLESIWIVLKGNLSLAFSAITAVLSLVFGGGTVLLNFLLSFVVFTTALFYLLSASGELYMPVDWFSKFTPSTTQSGSRFGQAVEEAVSGVFAASFKMAAFYGLYTWLLHTIFGVNIVFIPSALAAIFAAIPFLGTYWACVPAVLELWLIHGESVLAILLFVCQLLPTSFIDTAIYSEIKGGGHPYLTGLAIAGGIICLGLEGAIIGPILLCCLIVAVNMYGNMLQDSPMGSVIRPDSKSLLLKRSMTLNT